MPFRPLPSTRLLLSLLIAAAIAPHGSGQQNSILITDLPTDRLIRVTDPSSETGVQIRPNVAGFSFSKPWHLSVDASERIYIADRDNNRIVRMNDFAGNGWTALSQAGANNFGDPVGGVGNVVSVTVDRTGRIYICAGRIIRVDDMSGAGWLAFPPANRVPVPGGVGSLNNPKVLVFDPQGRFYVTDTDNHRVVRFDDMQGTGWVSFGSKGNGVGQFYRPEGIALDSKGRIYITDNLNNRIVRIDDMTGAGWIALGSLPGINEGQVAGPHDIQVDSSDRIWIADTGGHRIVRLNDMAGAGWVTFGTDTDPSLQLNAPKGIHVQGLGPPIRYTSALPRVQVGGAYRASIFGVNTGTDSVDATVSFTKPNGAAFPVTVDGAPAATVTRTVAPLGTIHLEASSTANLQEGYAAMRSSNVLDGGALLKMMNGDVVANEAAVRFVPPGKHFTFYIDNVNNARSGYTLANFGTTNAFYNLTLRDKSGKTLDTAVLTPTIFPGVQLTEFADQRFPAGVTPGFEGTIEFSSPTGSGVVSDGPGWRVGALGFRYDNPTSDVFTTIPAILNTDDPFPEDNFPPLPVSSPTTLYYPLIVDGKARRTILNFANLTGDPAAVKLDFFGSNGAPLAVPIKGVPTNTNTVTISPLGTVRLGTDGTSSEGVAGWARATSSVAIDGSEVIQSVVGGRVASEAGMGASPLGARFVSYVDGAGFAKSELTLCNPNNFAVPVALHLRDSSGQAIATTTRTLAAFAQVSKLVPELFPAVYTAFEGTVELTTAGPNISAAALRYDNPGGTVFALTPTNAVRGGVAGPAPVLTLPTLIQGGTVNGASFRSGAGVAPGSIATAFGINLAPAVPAGAALRLNGAPAFLFGAYPGQINFQVPWELAGQAQASMTATIDGVSAKPATVDLAPFSPGIFTLGGGQGAVVIASSGEVAAPIGSIQGLAVSPVRRGDYITIYCTGLGAVTNQPASGAQASATLLSATITTPSVTLGGAAVPATAGFFAGLAPGFVGLYQVNVQVPPNAPTGDAVPLALSIGGVTSNLVTIAVQ